MKLPVLWIVSALAAGILLAGARAPPAGNEVEVGGAPIDVSGGLRLNYFRSETAATEQEPELLPILRAGDRVEALLRARAPRNYGNPGAFDTRTYLARQNIHLTGSLRSAALLTKVGEPPPSLAHRA